MTERLKYYLLNWFEFEIIKPTMIDSMDDEDDDKLDLVMSDLDGIDTLLCDLDDDELDILRIITDHISRANQDGKLVEYVRSLKQELDFF